jgi:hypothetical protein
MTRYAFSYTVDDFDVMDFDEADEPQQMFIECNRGAHPSTALFCLRREDADSLFGSGGPVDITATPYEKEENATEWTEKEKIVWKAYYPCYRTEPDEIGNVWVTLKDKRVLLEWAVLNTEWNTIDLVAFEPGSETLYNFYTDEFCKASNTPHTVADIVKKIFDETTLTLPTVPAVTVEPVTNLSGRGDCATLLQGLLASVGFDLVLDPFADTLTITDLDTAQDEEIRETAKTDGKLIAKKDLEMQADEMFGIAEVLPSDYFPVSVVLSDTATFGTGKRSIVIADHQLPDKTTYTVKAARLAEIVDACEKWHRSQDDIFSETFWGLLKQVPGASIYSIRWNLSSEFGPTETQMENYVPPMPWPKRTEFECAVMFRGKAVAAIGATLARVEYYEQGATGAFTATGKEIKAVTIGAEIPAESIVAFWPGERQFIALRVC